MDQMQMVREYWSMFLRRFWIIAIFGGLGVSVSVAYAMLKPAVYEAEAKILVESPQIPEDMARSIVSGDAAERLQLIQQRLMTRNNLANLIQKFNLFTDRADLTMTDKVGQLRRATRILPISLNRQRGYRPNGSSISAFTIKVTLNDAGRAAQVANELVTMVLDQNLRVRREGAQGTLSFFSEEAKRLRQELAALELEISTFKNENKDALPINLTFNQEQLSRLEGIDREVDLEILRLEEERASIEAAIMLGRDAPGVTVSQGEQALQRLQTELARQRAIYAESHRIIRDLKAQIAAIEGQIQVVPNASETDGEEAEDPQVVELQRQIDVRTRQIVLQQDYKKELARKRENLITFIQRTPSVEIELNRLHRLHNEKQEMLGQINNKRITAETGERLEDSQQAERFEVIENAIRPNKPISPNRSKIVIMGSGGSIGFAFGLAFLVEMLFPRIRTAAQLERKLQLKPVVSIPYVQTAREKRRRFTIRAVVLAMIVFALPVGLFAVDQYYLPLPLMVERVAEKIGIDAVLQMIERRI